MKLLTITILYLAVYVFCVVWMLRLRIPRPPFVPIFLLLTVAALWTVLVLLPTGRLHGYMFTGLVTVAPTLLLLYSSLLFRRAERSIFHVIAMWLGWLYLAIPLFFMIILGIR